MKELLSLFLTFAKVGVMTFGGGYAMLPILQREVVENKGWATDEELTDYFAIGQCTPGVIAVNTATFIGQKRRGVIGGIVATDLFERFPEMDEGGLTRIKISLVSGETLSKVSKDLGMAPLIVMGESERGTGARGMHSALENVFESVVGALYLDAGYDATHDFVARVLGDYVSPALALRAVSPKSRLQEVTQREMHCAPEYKLVGEQGPAHDPTFTSVVLVNGMRIGRGEGSSKKSSESVAAQDALERLGYDNDGQASDPPEEPVAFADATD